MFPVLVLMVSAISPLGEAGSPAESRLQGMPPRAPIPAGTISHKDLAYVPDGHPKQKLDLYLPPKGTKAPLMVLVHGGAFMMGDKSGENVAPWLEQSIAVASINYRLSGDAIFPAAIEDVKEAIRWLRSKSAEYKFDGARIGVFGASAGGNLAALAGTTGDAEAFPSKHLPGVSSAVQVVVDWFGPTDFLQMDRQRLSNGQTHDPAESPESRYLGGPIQQRRDLARMANPITFISKGDPPFFIAHGDQDRNVPYGQSLLLVEALKKVGVRCEFLPMPGEGHGFRSIEPLTKSLAFVKSVFEK